jgi:signal transduction histidine kinase
MYFCFTVFIMKKDFKIEITALLMAFSWLLILFLAIEWLRGAWQTEREALTKELGHSFSEAKIQVMDSTLVLHIIEPMLRKEYNTEIRSGSGDRDSSGQRKIFMKDSISVSADATTRKSLVYSIKVTDSGNVKMPDIAWKSRLKADSGNIALHSIRLIVGNATDTSYGDPEFRELLPGKTDTSLFRRIFLDKLDKEGLFLKVRISTDSGNDPVESSKSRIIVSERMFEGRINAEITGFSWFLAKKVFPQFLFSILLLGLTAAAFIFTFRSLKKQIRLNEMRDGFLRNITHELKTPVATVKVALESLRRFDLQSNPRVTEEYLGMASQEMERLDRLIGRVLDVSLLEDKKQVIVLRNSDLKALVNRVISSLNLRLEQSDATVNLDAEDASYCCLLEELYTEGVLLNIIDNSLKYSVHEPVLNIGLKQNREQVILTIRDFGPGIPDEYIGRIFEKFFRVPTGDRHNVKGHGLGLTYVWYVMKQHGGRVEVENMPDRGCRFTLFFRKDEQEGLNTCS